jgi:N-acyl-phosphatidylethanolamine-hydrolysing phospholipase D
VTDRALLLLSLWGAAGCVSARDLGFYEPAVVGLPPDDASADLSAVWVGHATVLVRLGDQHVLTDPNLSGALFILPRHTPASLTPAELPPIDAVVISHLHFDHYDLPTLARLPPEVPVVFPRDSARYTTNLGRRKVALEPWTSVRAGRLRITAVPVAHFGGRYGFDAWWNRSYTGYVIEGHGRTVFFAGDTGYDPELFREVGRRFPRIDLALIPIGPFRNDRGNAVHTDPAEALQIFEDVGAEHMLPIHFEAYYGPFGGFDAPRDKLTRLVAERDLGARVHALRTGERLVAPWARTPPSEPPDASDPSL